MNIHPALLFWTPTLIWASTWHVILYQLAETPALAGVVWRFGAAGMLLLGLAAWRGEDWRLAPGLHPRLALIGLVQYGLNYWGVYEAERHIPSGLVAVLFSLMVFVNGVTGAWLFARPLTRRFVICAVLGVLGVALVFWPELRAAGARPQSLLGMGLGLAAVAAACTGNVLTLQLSQRGVSMVSLLGWSMGYGALALGAYALGSGASLAPGNSPAWWGSWAYLTLFGSVAAFLAYFRLAQLRGPGAAALTAVIIPVIALGISAAFENWTPHPGTWVGAALCILAVGFAVRRPAGKDS